MYDILRHTHGGLRWLLLVALVLAIFRFVTGWTRNRKFETLDKKLAIWTLSLAHLQFVIGLVMYFWNGYPQLLAENAKEVMINSDVRFFAVEHLLGMLVAIALITVGYSRAKRLTLDFKKFKVLLWTYLISLILILALIPWNRL